MISNIEDKPIESNANYNFSDYGLMDIDLKVLNIRGETLYKCKKEPLEEQTEYLREQNERYTNVINEVTKLIEIQEELEREKQKLS